MPVTLAATPGRVRAASERRTGPPSGPRRGTPFARCHGCPRAGDCRTTAARRWVGKRAHARLAQRIRAAVRDVFAQVDAGLTRPHDLRQLTPARCADGSQDGSCRPARAVWLRLHAQQVAACLPVAPPPSGAHASSRGVDGTLAARSTFQPYLLEVNTKPDMPPRPETGKYYGVTVRCAGRRGAASCAPQTR